MPRLTLAEYRDSSLRLESMIAGRLGYVHDFFLEFPYEVVAEPVDEPGDLVVILDNKDHRGKLDRLAHHDGRVVAVAAGGDGSFRMDVLPQGGLPENLVALFTINNEIGDHRVVSVPLGVRLESADRFRAAAAARTTPDRLLYANFSVGALYPQRNGKPHIRHRLAQQLEDVEWVDLDIAERHRGSEDQQLTYYRGMARHRFVLSPEGFGSDCYRHWESLYLGTIPIVQRNPAMSAFAELPILFTNDYTEIDQPYLEAQWRLLSERRFDLERLTTSFYRRRFQECIDRLDDPRFICWGFSGTDDEGFLDRLAVARHG